MRQLFYTVFIYARIKTTHTQTMHWRNSDFKIYQVKKVAKTPHLYTQKAQQTVSTATQTVSETSCAT